ncbi:acyl-CoA thioesterase [Pseudobacteriovorax antillogorgiicola]|uniref:acyl-CoA thioesterase n=1 Tax=Pseudobacteriovorax antillogorgiicola TaxID=1513793 RepID=UPI0013566A44|nr:thioesterase family protein [Pseudobacteriovorax antillogorgiicola]
MKTYRYPVEVRFRDTDNLGHINNAVYLTYSENCRTRFCQDVLGISIFGDGERIPLILARVEIDFLAQGFLHHNIYVDCHVSRIGTKSFNQVYEIKTENEILARSTAVLVWYDFDQDKSVPLPDETKEALKAYMFGGDS